MHVVRVPSPGAGGFLCHVPLAGAAVWWERCLGRGGAVPAGLEAYEVLRIESGVPWHGHDVTAETLALEAPYETAISFRKGCYLGQEVMERVTARGHVNRKLVGVEVPGDAVPETGTRLYAGDREVGWLTSAARAWRLRPRRRRSRTCDASSSTPGRSWHSVLPAAPPQPSAPSRF